MPSASSQWLAVTRVVIRPSLKSRKYLSKTRPSSWRPVRRFSRLVQPMRQVNLALAYDEKSSNSVLNEKRNPFLSLSQSSSSLDHRKPPVINTFSDLQYQTEIDRPARRGRPRLVDDGQWCRNYALWATLLEARLRLHGTSGAKVIWSGMRIRGIDLPTSGSEVDDIWRPIVNAAISDNIMLDELWSHVTDLYRAKQWVWPELYNVTMRSRLLQDCGSAPQWHVRFEDLGLPSKFSIARLADAAVTSKEALLAYKEIYLAHQDYTIYDAIIGHLCQQHLWSHAIQWHSILISVGDLPEAFAPANELRTYCANHGYSALAEQISTLLEDVCGLEKSYPPASLPPAPATERRLLTGKMLNEAIDSGRGINPRGISDGFAARTFATRSISIDVLIASISTFGLQKLGPQAMRELGLRCESTADFVEKLNTLKQRKVQIDDCVFNAVVMDAAKEGNFRRMRSILENDMHHECYEDGELQLKLVRAYVAKHDWEKAYIPLLVLCKYLEAAHTTDDIWNDQLKKQVSSGQWDTCSETIESMLQLAMPIRERTLDLMYTTMVLQSQRGAEGTQKQADVQMLANLWLRMMRGGVEIPLRLWEKIHTFLGQSLHLGSMEKLTIELATFYSPHNALRNTADQTSEPGHAHIPGEELQNFFCKKRIQAIVAWGFISIGNNVSRTQLARGFVTPLGNRGVENDWTRGLELVLLLRKMGVKFSDGVVRQTVLQRLAILFGNGSYVSGREKNERSKQSNRTSVEKMIGTINAVWPGGMFEGEDEVPGLAVLNRRLASPRTQWILRRAQSKKTSRKLRLSAEKRR